ncbi:hypothetical protein TCAL_00061, partial [Tigriopus californicus]|eukprot:TCALIF_00061-PA protein Name:"Protein of unknown function" AED:0.12 eAED:0.12 QI:216/0/0/0.66/0.5/0.66/3/0/106
MALGQTRVFHVTGGKGNKIREMIPLIPTDMRMPFEYEAILKKFHSSVDVSSAFNGSVMKADVGLFRAVPTVLILLRRTDYPEQARNLATEYIDNIFLYVLKVLRND